MTQVFQAMPLEKPRRENQLSSVSFYFIFKEI